MGQGVCICVCVCVMQRRVLREEVAGIARPVGVRLRGRKALGAEKPLPHPGHPGKATCLNCSNTRNTPWFQVSHLCVPEAGRGKGKEPYSRGTTPEAEGLAHRGASLPQQDGPSQGCSLPPTGCSLTGVPPSPSRILPHRSAPFLQQDPPLQGYSLPPAGSSWTFFPADELFYACGCSSLLESDAASLEPGTLGPGPRVPVWALPGRRSSSPEIVAGLLGHEGHCGE